MNFTRIHPENDLSEIVHVLNISHATVAEEYAFTKENNPSNNAFIDEPTLRAQLNKGIVLYVLSIGGILAGCIAIEKSATETGTFYIEKVSVIPEYRNKEYGLKLMDFATAKIMEAGGKVISIALIDSNSKLKSWYSKQGFVETGTKDFKHLPFRVCFMRKELY
jgi:diamine N-acetyltransferase